MQMQKHIILKMLVLISWMFIQQETTGQENKFAFNGYVSNMFSYTSAPKEYNMLFGQSTRERQWISNHYLHNRMNLFAYPLEGLKASMQIRNRLFYGDYIADVPGYKSMLSADNGWIDLSANLLENDHAVFNTAVDRFWLEYTFLDLEIKAGRQRINWSQTFAFNPNDIFNTYSFFEVDYPERPGSDAVKVTWYPSYTSTAEGAISLDSAKQITAAGFYRFNQWSYDFQFLGGILKEQDIVLGTGWSGSIRGAGFRGELSYFHPTENMADTTGILVTSVSLDYMFDNSLYLQLETLYNQLPPESGNGFLQVFSQPMSVKTLSFTEYNLLLNASYPVSPLVSTTLSTIWYPKMDAFFAGPSLQVSITDNLGASLFWQTFYGEFPTLADTSPKKAAFHFAYLRAKWNF